MAQSIEQLIVLMSQQVAQLHQQRRYDEAISIANQCAALAGQHLGNDHPDYALSLTNLASLNRLTRNYAAALPLYQKASEVYRRALGEHHEDYAMSLTKVASVYQSMGNYAAALPLYQKASEINRTALGEHHEDYAMSLNNLASVYQLMGNYAAALPLYQKASEVYRTALGEHNEHYVMSLNKLASVYQLMGNYVAAEPILQKASEVYCTALGEHHEDYAMSLNNLALLYELMGKFTAAEPLHHKAREICGKALGEKHPFYATSLNNLAALYKSMGNYAAAEPLYQQTLPILRAALGENSPDYASCLNNLALLYQSTGNYAAAEQLHQRALGIRGTALGEDHQDYATSLNNLAMLYESIGNYAAAEPLYQRAREILRRALGEHHPNYAGSLSNLAGLYNSIGNYAAAEPLYHKALDVNRRALGEAHPSYATTLSNLGGLYRSIGNYAAAEPLYQKALEAYRIALGEHHPDYASSLNNLAVLYQLMGSHAAAAPLHQKALEIRYTAIGEDHPDYATSLNNLALTYVATGRQAEAMTLMQQAATIDDRMIGQVFSIGSESQRMAYLRTIQSNFEGFLSLLSHSFSSSPAAVYSALALVLRRKAIGAEALAAQRDAVLGGRYPVLEPKLKVLTTLRMQIAQKTLAGPGFEDLASHQKLLAEWNAQKERLEAELVRQIPEMNLEQKLSAADRNAVALALPPDSALVEFVRLNIFDFMAVAARGELRWLPPHYFAFVMSAQEPDNVRMTDLGPAEPIDQMIATFRASITGEGESRGYQDQEATLSEGSSNLSANDGYDLRVAIFDPLLPAIGDRRRMLLAPDGDLTRLPFEVLPTANGRRLIDDYRISYLGAGRDVMRFGAAAMSQATAPLVVADPDFDLGSQVIAHPPQPASESEVEASSLPRHSRDMDGSAMHFGRLPGTQVEGQRIAHMLGVEPRLAAAALESQLKACHSPRILHLATHGFFLADQKRDPNEEQGSVTVLGEQSSERLGRFSGRGLENPLLRSGLALAGVNTWLQQGTVPTEAEDGILTAEDVSGLDLLATELVVLSACETGLGEVHTGEGVFGLRRAFVLAGAKTLVMSLWKVSDLSTAILMERFYLNLLQRKMGRDESLREAQFYTRDLSVGEIRDGWLRAEVIESLAAGDEKAKNYFQRLARKPDEHQPFSGVEYWGAFICQGDPAAIVDQLKI